MPKPCTFLAIVDGVPKWWNSYAIDRYDALAQMREIYTDTSDINVVLFRHV